MAKRFSSRKLCQPLKIPTKPNGRSPAKFSCGGLSIISACGLQPERRRFFSGASLAKYPNLRYF
jgi:hypothetical protein